MPSIDPLVVLRSARELDAYGPDFQYSHNVQVKSGLQLAMGIAGFGAVTALAKVGATRELLRKVRSPGEGPSAEERARSWFQVTFQGKSASREVVTRVSGGDPGYSETAKMVAESALCMAFDRERLPARAGVITPVVAMGERLIERLQAAGIRFELLGGELRRLAAGAVWVQSPRGPRDVDLRLRLVDLAACLPLRADGARVHHGVGAPLLAGVHRSSGRSRGRPGGWSRSSRRLARAAGGWPIGCRGRARRGAPRAGPREKGGYARHDVPLHLADGAAARAEITARSAIVYLATPDNPDYLGAAPLPEIAAQVLASHGPSGSNVEYVLRLADALAAMGAHDEHVTELAASSTSAELPVRSTTRAAVGPGVVVAPRGPGRPSTDSRPVDLQLTSLLFRPRDPRPVGRVRAGRRRRRPPSLGLGRVRCRRRPRPRRRARPSADVS